MTEKALAIVTGYINDVRNDGDYIDVVVATRSGKEYHVDIKSAEYASDWAEEGVISIFEDEYVLYIDNGEVESIKVIRN